MGKEEEPLAHMNLSLSGSASAVSFFSFYFPVHKNTGILMLFLFFPLKPNIYSWLLNLHLQLNKKMEDSNNQSRLQSPISKDPPLPERIFSTKPSVINSSLNKIKKIHHTHKAPELCPSQTPSQRGVKCNTESHTPSQVLF